MRVRIVSAPKTLDLFGIIENITFCLGKVVYCNDTSQPYLQIDEWDDADIYKLASKGITVESAN